MLKMMKRNEMNESSRKGLKARDGHLAGKMRNLVDKQKNSFAKHCFPMHLTFPVSRSELVL